MVEHLNLGELNEIETEEWWTTQSKIIEPVFPQFSHPALNVLHKSLTLEPGKW